MSSSEAGQVAYLLRSMGQRARALEYLQYRCLGGRSIIYLAFSLPALLGQAVR